MILKAMNNEVSEHIIEKIILTTCERLIDISESCIFLLLVKEHNQKQTEKTNKKQWKTLCWFCFHFGLKRKLGFMTDIVQESATVFRKINVVFMNI